MNSTFSFEMILKKRSNKSNKKMGWLSDDTSFRLESSFCAVWVARCAFAIAASESSILASKFVLKEGGLCGKPPFTGLSTLHHFHPKKKKKFACSKHLDYILLSPTLDFGAGKKIKEKFIR